jgi:hypothetical protein
MSGLCCWISGGRPQSDEAFAQLQKKIGSLTKHHRKRPFLWSSTLYDVQLSQEGLYCSDEQTILNDRLLKRIIDCPNRLRISAPTSFSQSLSFFETIPTRVLGMDREVSCWSTQYGRLPLEQWPLSIKLIQIIFHSSKLAYHKCFRTPTSLNFEQLNNLLAGNFEKTHQLQSLSISWVL